MTRYSILHIPTGEYCAGTKPELIPDMNYSCKLVSEYLLSARHIIQEINCAGNCCENCIWHKSYFNAHKEEFLLNEIQDV